MTVRLTGAMSMRQNDFGGASRAIRIAARITAGWVTATSRLRRLVNVSIQPRTRSIRSTTDSPPCGALVGSVSQMARSAGRTPPSTSPRQRPQSRSASRCSMLACRPRSSAVCLVRFSGPQKALSVTPSSIEASTWRCPTEFSGSSVGNRPADIASVMACDTSVSRTTSLMPRLPLAPVLARPSLRSSLALAFGSHAARYAPAAAVLTE